MAIKGAINRGKRMALDYSKGFTDGSLGKMPKAAIDKMTKYDIWQSAKVGGKVANLGMQHIGGQLGALVADPVQYIKQFDPGNTSGAVKDALDIMEKLQSATMSDDLLSSIAPLKSILGSSLLSSMKKAGAGAKANQKMQKQQANTESNTVTSSTTSDIIQKLIAAAIAKIDDAEKAVEAAELLDYNEIQAIQSAYDSNSQYSSSIEVKEFVDAINSLIPIFKTIGEATS